jgi:hypothetical protein
MAFGFIKINDKLFPAPDNTATFEVATLVSGGKNANGAFVGQKVGRDQYKISDLQWHVLDAAVWSEILRECEKFILVVQFPDMVKNGWTTLKMYPGNRTATPLEFTSDGMPTRYKNCKVNIIDCGL